MVRTLSEEHSRKLHAPRTRPFGSKRLDLDGHVLIKVLGRGWIFEHRFVMEQHLGRRLLSTEIVHHKDFNPANNLLENLEIVTRSNHNRIHEEAKRSG